MKKQLFYLVLFLSIPSLSFGATVIFSTGFESAVALDAPGATSQYFSDCAGAGTGCTDASTGYNVPFGMPGNGTEPWFNFVRTGNDIVTIDGTYYVGGIKSLATYFDHNYVDSANSRVQLVVTSNNAASLSSGDNFKRTLVHFYLKIPTMPSINNKWIIINEWQYGSVYPGRLMWFNESGTLYLQWFGGGSGATYWGAHSWGDRTAVTKADYENKWVEYIVFYENGTSGKCIVWAKPEGGTPALLVNYSGNNSTSITSYQPIKAYGSESDQNLYWDNFRWYSSTGYTDLPAWDSETPPPPPPGTISYIGPTAIADISHRGPSAISDLSAIGPSSLVESGETEQEMGYTAVTGGTPTHTATSRCSRHTSVGAMTVNYGYTYTQDYQQNNSDTVTLAVYNSDGGSPSKPSTQNGGCSSTATITNDDMHWEQVTWADDNPVIAATTEYFVCQYINGDIGTYYVTGSANDEWYETDTSCPGVIDAAGSTRNTTLTVSNFDAH